MKTILEQQAEIPVFDEADIVVVGAGPAGHSAAVAAARAGAKKVILLERYGHMGGMATGGLVILVPHLSVGDKTIILGLVQEWMDRLEKIPGGMIGTPLEDTGSSDPEVLEKWKKYYSMIWDDVICHGYYVDADILKIVCDQMIQEEGDKITTYLHCWGTKAIVEDDTVKGVIFESKEGRKAILAKVVIDCTGDGDIFASAGAEFEEDRDRAARSAMTAVVYRIGGTDFEAYGEYKVNNNDEWRDVHQEKLKEITGFKMGPFPTPRNDVMWVNNWLPDRYCLDVKDLTDTEMTVRKTMLEAIEYLRENVPGFKNAFLYDIAPQLGTRGSRRLVGEYKLTMDDIKGTFSHEDTISFIPAMALPISKTPTEIPYRTLVPIKIENLLVAGRCFSSEAKANNFSNLIPHCIAMGQAAGVAATFSIEDNTSVRNVDIKRLREELKRQDVYLP